MKKNSRQNLRKITVMAMLAAVAVVSVYFIKFPLLPSAPFLEYDIADVPVLIGTMLFGPSAGLVILLITSAIQAFTVSSSSHIIGFLMHFCASGVLVLASGLMYKKIGGKKGMAAGLAAEKLRLLKLLKETDNDDNDGKNGGKVHGGRVQKPRGDRNIHGKTGDKVAAEAV